MFGNNETSQALGQAHVTMAIHGTEQTVRMHVVEGQTPMLLSSKWLYDQEAVIDFRAGHAWFPKISKEVIQLERAPTYHLMVPITASEDHEAAKSLTQVTEDNSESRLLRACTQLQETEAAPKASPSE